MESIYLRFILWMEYSSITRQNMTNGSKYFMGRCVSENPFEGLKHMLVTLPGLKTQERDYFYFRGIDYRMRIDDLIWLEQFIEKLETKHGVYIDEVEELFANRPALRRIRKGRVPGEDVYRAFGQTYSGRYLAVFFIYKPGALSALVISARDMDSKERKSYNG